MFFQCVRYKDFRSITGKLFLVKLGKYYVLCEAPQFSGEDKYAKNILVPTQKEPLVGLVREKRTILILWAVQEKKIT